MTNQIIDILLERPEKVERMVILLLKTLITTWILNLFIVYFESDSLSMDEDSINFASLEFLDKISALKSAGYIVLFIILWFILWEILANWLLPSICKLLVWIIQIFLIIIPIIFNPILVGYRRVFKKEIIVDNENMSETQKFFSKLNDENRNRFFFGSLLFFII